MADLTNPHSLTEMITGYWKSQAVYAATSLGIADLLRDGPKSVEELAQTTGTKSPFLYRLLRALASVGVFAEDAQGRFGLTPLAELLRSDVEGSQRALALMNGEEHYAVWGLLTKALHTGENAFETVHGMPIFEFLAEHADKGKTFDQAMTGIHGRETAAMLAAYDFSQFGVLADVGGGNGTTITRILQHCSSLRGILFDLPHVAGRAATTIEAAGVKERCDVLGGSFFESVPEGADAYLMRHIIHDWDDEKSLAILRACHRAMRPGNKLLVVECVIPAGNGPFQGKFLDLTMMLIPGGQERTADEYRRLYEQAGFELTRIVPTSLEVSVVEGVKR